MANSLIEVVFEFHSLFPFNGRRSTSYLKNLLTTEDETLSNLQKPTIYFIIATICVPEKRIKEILDIGYSNFRVTNEMVVR